MISKENITNQLEALDALVFGIKNNYQMAQHFHRSEENQKQYLNAAEDSYLLYQKKLIYLKKYLGVDNDLDNV